MASLPFITNQTEFSAACQHFGDSFLSKYGLEYSLRQSPYDKDEKYVVIQRATESNLKNNNVVGISSPEKRGEETDTLETSPHSLFESLEDEDAEELRIPEVSTGAMSDNEGVNPQGAMAKFTVEHHIVFSPMHRLPVLYFNLYPSTGGGKLAPVTSLDTVYQLLVPSERVRELRDVGATGAISQGMHPLLDVPFWFVHPCETAEALRAWGSELSLENYLSLWVGLTAGVVGLDFPLPKRSLSEEGGG